MVYSHSGWQHLFREIYRTQPSFISIFIISKSTCPAPARTGLIFAASRRGHGQDSEVILYYHRPLQGQGKGLSSGKKRFLLVKEAWWREQLGGASSILKKAAG